MRHTVKLVAGTILYGIGFLIVYAAEQQDMGWETLFDGSSLDNWAICTTSGHGDTKDWTILEGAIEGTQDKPGNGGVLLSKETYGDFLLDRMASSLEVFGDYSDPVSVLWTARAI